MGNVDVFWAEVRMDPATCWEWQGKKTREGYGLLGDVVGRQLGLRGNTYAHRFAWESHVGPIPAHMFVCHACDNPACVRPGHLLLGNARSNAVDRDRKGRGFFKPKLACGKGHVFTPESTYFRPDGRGRACLICLREYEARYRRLNGPHGRGSSKDRTHCPLGHPYDAENTYVSPKGDRRCRKCRGRWVQ